MSPFAFSKKVADEFVAGVVEDSFSDESPFVGIGLGYDISEVLEINLAYDFIKTDDADPTLATIGLTLRF